VIHQRKSAWEALFSGRGYRDWYVAQVSARRGSSAKRSASAHNFG
jgi:hypothetical protein